MRVAPWSQYQLVDQETDPYPDLQLAPGKNQLVRGCASFVCIGRHAAGREKSFPLKVGPTQNQEVLPEPVDIDESKVQVNSVDDPVNYNENIRAIVSLKSSLKKSANIGPVVRAADSGNSSKHEADAGPLERRKVQWTDTTGGELFEIREFEMRCSSRKQGCTLRLIWYLLSCKVLLLSSSFFKCLHTICTIYDKSIYLL
ncbi:uncharacterized protein LOC121782836 isoform X1 [Salvia splendens]|uniref:uncharacterized protein LOC121782836 isoform X1 n=1 Tax=Salvia splendens TaxID=180675 RepID=UPI001C271A8D|nr:uncharacterized protein LOC121782836 isoform X1 [Salvia splendens]